MDNEIDLYKKLLSYSEEVKDFTKNSLKYHSQLEFSDLNKACYDVIYSSLKAPIKRQDLFPKIPALKKECGECWKFYLNPRNKSIIILDIKLGEKFQEALRVFLKGYEIDCRKGDISDKRYPDNAVYNEESIKAYLEVKYQSAPWIYAYKSNGNLKECYESSPALDVKKLNQQYELKKTGQINVPIYYVYWLDFPCIKGLFYISIDEAYALYKKKAEVFDRKEREGDYLEKNNMKVKKASTEKIHISIYEMKPFSVLLGDLM